MEESVVAVSLIDTIITVFNDTVRFGMGEGWGGLALFIAGQVPFVTRSHGLAGGGPCYRR